MSIGCQCLRRHRRFGHFAGGHINHNLVVHTQNSKIVRLALIIYVVLLYNFSLSGHSSFAHL